MNAEKETVGSLLFTHASSKEQVVILRENEALQVGRGSDCDIVLDDATASRKHAIFSASNYGISVADMQSRNGTFVNGDPVSGTRDLEHNDIVNIGASKIVVNLSSHGTADDLMASGAITVDGDVVHAAVLTVVIRNYEMLNEKAPQQHTTCMLTAWKTCVIDALKASREAQVKEFDNYIVALWMNEQLPLLANPAMTAAQNIIAATEKLKSSGIWPHRKEIPWNTSVLITSASIFAEETDLTGKEQEDAFTLLGDPVNDTLTLNDFVDKTVTAPSSLVIVSELMVSLADKPNSLTSLAKMMRRDKREQIEIFSL